MHVKNLMEASELLKSAVMQDAPGHMFFAINELPSIAGDREQPFRDAGAVSAITDVDAHQGMRGQLHICQAGVGG
jgi:hypothetical protein